MRALSLLRGHPVYRVSGDVWRFVDTGEPTAETWRERGCGHCGRDADPDEPDPCLGWLPGVRNACCGHGERAAAYVQFTNGVVVRGFDVVETDDMTTWLDDQ